MSRMLQRSFFEQPAPELASQLLGMHLIHQAPDGLTSGIIVETEAYSQEDAASHSFKGETPRTKAMFGPGGHAYIYFTYGMHYCFNVVSGRAGEGQGVLIRALEPVEGIDIMRRRRKTEQLQLLTNGPAKLVQAMGITKSDYGTSLLQGNLRIEDTGATPEIMSGPRIGITKAVDVPWRFWIVDNKFVSRI